MLGIDVSYHQGPIDWDKVKESGVEFAIVRAGYGKNNIDKMAHYNCLRCNELGIHLGAYWFSYALNETMAIKEADYFATFLAYHKFDMPVYFDFEYDSLNYLVKNKVNATKNLINNIARVFCERMELHGFYVGIYSNKDWISNYFNKEIFDRYDLWLADYTKNPSMAANLHQYSDKLKIPGIKGNVDGNLANVNFPAIIAANYLNNL